MVKSCQHAKFKIEKGMASEPNLEYWKFIRNVQERKLRSEQRKAWLASEAPEEKGSQHSSVRGSQMSMPLGSVYSKKTFWDRGIPVKSISDFKRLYNDKNSIEHISELPAQKQAID